MDNSCQELCDQAVAGDQSFAANKRLEKKKSNAFFYPNLRWKSEKGGNIRHYPGNKMASFTFRIHFLISANVFYLFVIKQNYAVAVVFEVT